jgi:hypothetical protein
MRSPCCLSVYPSVSVHISVHPPLIFARRLVISPCCLRVCVPINFCYESYEINLLSVCPLPTVARQQAICVFVWPFNFFLFYAVRDLSKESR